MDFIRGHNTPYFSREYDFGPVKLTGPWGLFLESPGNLTGPKSYFEIKVSRKVGTVLSCNEVHFVSLADTFAA